LPRKPQGPEKIYRETTQATVVLDLPPGKYRVEWIDTKTGRVAARDEFEHGGKERKQTSSRFSVDVALRMIAR